MSLPGVFSAVSNCAPYRKFHIGLRDYRRGYFPRFVPPGTGQHWSHGRQVSSLNTVPCLGGWESAGDSQMLLVQKFQCLSLFWPLSYQLLAGKLSVVNSRLYNWQRKRFNDTFLKFEPCLRPRKSRAYENNIGTSRYCMVLCSSHAPGHLVT